MSISAIQFVDKYDQYVKEIKKISKPKYNKVVDRMLKLDPHDFVRPEAWFSSEQSARGFVWTMFLSQAKKMK